VGVSVFVFEERAASEPSGPRGWIEREIRTASKVGRDTPKSSSPRLAQWFDDMRSSFPPIQDAHPDDATGTEYCFYENVIDVIFATSVGEQGVLRAWQLAEKHGLRISFGDEVLPRTAPADEEYHLPGLHGRPPSKPGALPNVCFVVFDPDVTGVAPREARTWALRRLQAGPCSEEPAVLTSNRMRRWMDQYAIRKLDALVSEIRFYDDLVFIRVSRNNSASMVSPIMELSHALNLPFEVFTDID
jgi:hypothetical protein